MPRVKRDQSAGTGTSETKNDKFQRLAKNRVARATSALQSIGKLANTYNYDYTEAEAQKIINHLSKEMDELKRRFSVKPRKPGNGFSFD